VTRNGYGKRTKIDQYSRQGRYGFGAKTLQRTDKTGDLVAMRAIKASDGIMLISRNGIVIRTDLESIRESNRGTQGVKIMNLGKGDDVVGIAIIQEDGDEEGILLDEEGNELVSEQIV